MDYIWDIAIKAKECNRKKSDLFFKQSENVSPWYEQSFTSLNQDRIYDNTIEINALCRFSEIFREILHKDLEELEEFRKFFYDLSMHFLCDIDLYKGITKNEIYLSKIKQEIVLGIYGDSYKEMFQVFTEQEKNKILPLMFKQIEIGSSILIFNSSIKRIYPDVLIYQVKEDKKQLLMYLGFNKNLLEEKRVKFLVDIFLPLNFDIRIFWGNHFGVLGTDATMIADEIAIF